MEAKSQKALIWTFFVLSQIYTWSYVSLVEFWPPVSPSLNAAQVLELYTRHTTQFRTGIVLMMLSGAFMLPLVIVVAAQMARYETGFRVWSKLQLCAGTLGAWLFAFPPFLWGVAAFTVERDPALTLLFHEFGWLCFVTPPSYFAMQIVPMAVIAFSKNNDDNSAFPRWFGYLTLWVAVSGSVGVIAMMFRAGPFAWNGAISFYLPLVMFCIWLVSLVYCLVRAINRQQRAAYSRGLAD